MEDIEYIERSLKLLDQDMKLMSDYIDRYDSEVDNLSYLEAIKFLISNDRSYTYIARARYEDDDGIIVKIGKDLVMLGEKPFTYNDYKKRDWFVG